MDLFKRDDGDIYLSPRGTQGLTCSVAFTALATTFVGLRLYTRTRIMRRMESNDWMILIALVNSYIFMGLAMVEATSGMGMHLKDIPPAILERQMKAFWLTIPFYNAGVLCAKASILIQYFRVFPTQRMRIVCWVMITILAIYGTWAVISAFLNCIPVAKFWDDSIPGFCLSKPGLWFSNASMHIATDLVILIIPIPALIIIEVPRKQKVALMILFALGGFVCITSIVRLVSLKKISDSTDPTFDNVGAASWSAIECNTGIICACLPTLKPLISKLAPGLLSSMNGSRRQGSGHMSHPRRNTTWNDESTLGAPSEDPGYGAGDPERILELVPSGAAKYGRRWSKEDKDKGLGINDITEFTKLGDSEYTGHHLHTVSETSVYSRN
ncbi:Integral membrane protein [Penicillium sp. IBT 16267x]|nr:Integral membrane protein [Penicillium sp. IBT 16267x]